MNKLIISGNLVKEVEPTFTQGSGLAVVKNTIASKRKIKDKTSGKYESDFINIVAFGKTAEFIANNFTKGQGILLEAHVQSGSYENKEGKKVYTFDAIVDAADFLGSKATSNGNNSAPTNQTQNTFNDGNFDDIIPVDDGDMPF